MRATRLPLLLVLSCLAPVLPAQAQEPMPDPEWEAHVAAAAGDLAPEERELVLSAYQSATSIPLIGIMNGECYALRFRDYIGEHDGPPDARRNARFEFSRSREWAECVERDRLEGWARARAITMFLRKLPVGRNQSRCLTSVLAAASAQPRRPPQEWPCLDGIDAALELTTEGGALMRELREDPEAVLARYDPDGLLANITSDALGAELLLELVHESARREAGESYEQYLECIATGYADEYLKRLKDPRVAGLDSGGVLRNMYSDVALECDRS